MKDKDKEELGQLSGLIVDAVKKENSRARRNPFKEVPKDLPDDFWVRFGNGAQQRVWVMSGQMQCLDGEGRFTLFTRWADVVEYHGPGQSWIKV